MSPQNMLETGLQWLANKQKKHVSSRVIYCRNEKRIPVDAVLGRTKFDIVDENGFRVSSHTIDFLIRAEELELVPKTGDQIISNNIVHEVSDLGDGCWRWCDPHDITRRIHTQIYKGEK